MKRLINSLHPHKLLSSLDKSFAPSLHRLLWGITSGSTDIFDLKSARYTPDTLAERIRKFTP